MKKLLQFFSQLLKTLLPSSVQRRWRNQVAQLMRKQRRIISSLADFEDVRKGACASTDALYFFFYGYGLSKTARTAIAKHLFNCPRCCKYWLDLVDRFHLPEEKQL